MRLKARLAKESIGILLSIASTFEKIGKSAAFYLTTDTLRIALINENMEEPKCFSEILLLDDFFIDYRIESISENNILLEVNLNHFVRALASAKNSVSCQIKLTKKDSKPLLCLETKSIGIPFITS